MREEYKNFLMDKTKRNKEQGFEPNFIPDCLFDFQKMLVEWAVRNGRAALFEDCGLGKTVQQLTFAQNVVRHTNKPVILVTPLAVGAQTVLEADKFGIEAERNRNGKQPTEKKIYVTNYEQLHKFNPDDFGGIVCDESSAIKNFKGERKEVVTEFCRTLKYRLLCTATAAPNDYWELGTSSEALGYLGFRDMLTSFFKQETSKDFRGWGRTKYRFKGHAEEPFWRWVCGWSRSCKRPSDLGFDDKGFQLPELTQKEYVVKTEKTRDGMLFALPATNLNEQRQERRNSIMERCDKAAEIAHSKDDYSVIWCELNDEGDMLEKVIEDSIQVKGGMSDEQKEESLIAFSNGEVKRLITKPKIGAWGLNWQHCNNVISFPSHSFESHYQAVRRCWRFGQKRPVNVSLIVNEGEIGVIKNLERKSLQCENMFESLVKHMGKAIQIESELKFKKKETIPQWLNETLQNQSQTC
jgi:hypothetical protein